MKENLDLEANTLDYLNALDSKELKKLNKIKKLEEKLKDFESKNYEIFKNKKVFKESQ